MLAKCMKWDFKALMHLLGVLYVSVMAMLLGAVVLPGIFDEGFIFHADHLGYIAFIVTIFACGYASISVLVYTVKTLFEKPAYQYHSIPAPSSVVILSKILVGAFIHFLVMLVLFINTQLMLKGIGADVDLINMIELMIHRLSSEFIPQWPNTLINLLMFFYIMFAFISVQISAVAVGAMSNFSVFQSMGKVKYIVGYICFYVLQQLTWITIVMLYGSTLQNLPALQESLRRFEQSGQISPEFKKLFYGFVLAMTIGYVIFYIGMYVFSKNRITKHLNLS